MRLAIPAGIVSLALVMSACSDEPPPPDCDAALCVAQAVYKCSATTGVMEVTVSKAQKDEVDVNYDVTISTDGALVLGLAPGLLTEDSPSLTEVVGPATFSVIIIRSEEGMEITRSFFFDEDCP